MQPRKTREEVYKLLHPTKKEIAKAIKDHKETDHQHDYLPEKEYRRD